MNENADNLDPQRSHCAMSPLRFAHTLFHVTDVANVDSILRYGLRADDDGCIFTLTDDLLANSIARDQLFLDRYAVIMIDMEGITGRVEHDEVAELSAPWHRVIMQPCIKPEFLDHFYTECVDLGPTDGDYMRWATRGWTREQVDEMFDQGRRAMQVIDQSPPPHAGDATGIDP